MSDYFSDCLLGHHYNFSETVFTNDVVSLQVKDNIKILSIRKEIHIRFFHMLSGNWRNLDVYLIGNIFVEKLEYFTP